MRTLAEGFLWWTLYLYYVIGEESRGEERSGRNHFWLQPKRTKIDNNIFSTDIYYIVRQFNVNVSKLFKYSKKLVEHIFCSLMCR